VSQAAECELTCPCPPIGLIDIVGKKWAVCVVSLLGANGPARFGPIQRCLSGVSPATLTSTLRSLERARLIHRVSAESSRGPVKAYALTPSGRSLYDSIRPFADWLRAV
jgi:DNA-binding HxlR family transcriptional regulator